MDPNHKASNSMFFLLMGHCDDGYISGEDGEKILIVDLLNVFSSKNCPLLNGKPKVFIFQTCHGCKPSIEIYIYLLS